MKSPRGKLLRRQTRPLWAAIVLAVGCASGAPPPADDLLLPMNLPVRWLPEPSDKAAAKLARAALSNDEAGVERAFAEVKASNDSHTSEDLVPLCTDLVNATRNDSKGYREASKRLKSGWGTDPALQARLDQAVEDDPLKLAWRRRRDTWEVLWARTFNAVSEPLGKALMTGFIFAPITIANSTVHYVAAFSNDEPLSLTDRQALALRKQYVAHNPDADDTAKVQRQIAGAEKKLAKTMRKRRMREAKAAHRAGASRAALLSARRVLFWGPDRTAERILDESLVRIEQDRELKDRSLEATPTPMVDLQDADDRALMIDLLATSSRAAPLAPDSMSRLKKQLSGEHADEARYLLAMAQIEAGYEEESWQSLARLAAKDPADSPMSRHARSLIGDPWQDPYEAYQQMKGAKRREIGMWRAFGHWSKTTRYPNLPRPLGYLIDAPSVAQTLVTSPVRLIFGTWHKGPDFQKPTAVLAYRYLGRFPDGAHAQDVMKWLYDYEEGRGNTVAALRVADFIHDFDGEERAELAEEASAQTVAAAARAQRPDRRTALLRQAVKEYPDTSSGQSAGVQVRREFEQASPQRISVTRSFLQENPRVAGENGFGINPILINGDIEDGELHPTGVVFAGGRTLRFNLVAESGDEDDEPQFAFRNISTERLSRVASTLDETARRNELIDADDTLPPDADRDQFIERARLGLAEVPDNRPTAQSTFVYKSMRERYGMVRGRESILPFDLVLRGSMGDMSLGAFPRWRQPKQTPDAYLYR